MSKISALDICGPTINLLARIIEREAIETLYMISPDTLQHSVFRCAPKSLFSNMGFFAVCGIAIVMVAVLIG
jgi:hypothetical protein